MAATEEEALVDPDPLAREASSDASRTTVLLGKAALGERVALAEAASAAGEAIGAVAGVVSAEATDAVAEMAEGSPVTTQPSTRTCCSTGTRLASRTSVSALNHALIIR